MTVAAALAELQARAGTRFDPLCVSAFVRMRAPLEKLRGERTALGRTDCVEEPRPSWAGTEAPHGKVTKEPPAVAVRA